MEDGGLRSLTDRTERGCSFYFWSALLLLLFIGVPALYIRYSDPPGEKASSSRFAEDKLAPGWTRFEDCRHIVSEYFDGDSFMAETADGERIVFRLYFVDAPETDDRYPKRNAEQAKVFGVKDVRPLGEKARGFTRKFLRKGFTATTRHQRAAGMSGLPRSYAFVEVDGELLSEALLRAGLGRPYGRDTALPDGNDKYKHWDRLNKMALFGSRE